MVKAFESRAVKSGLILALGAAGIAGLLLLAPGARPGPASAQMQRAELLAAFRAHKTEFTSKVTGLVYGVAQNPAIHAVMPDGESCPLVMAMRPVEVPQLNPENPARYVTLMLPAFSAAACP